MINKVSTLCIFSSLPCLVYFLTKGIMHIYTSVFFAFRMSSVGFFFSAGDISMSKHKKTTTDNTFSLSPFLVSDSALPSLCCFRFRDCFYSLSLNIEHLMERKFSCALFKFIMGKLFTIMLWTDRTPLENVLRYVKEKTYAI